MATFRKFLKTFPRSARWAVTLGVLSLGLALGAGGCSDMVTYAGASRQKGIELYNQKSYADAAGAFTNAIRQDPVDYQSHYYLGRSYEAMKQYFQSVQAYRMALDVMKNSLAGREDTIFRLKVLDGLASAMAAADSRELEQAAVQNRASPTAEDHFVLARASRIRGDADTAVDEYNKATQQQTDRPAEDIALAKESGLYLAQIGQTQKAAQQLTRAYVLNRRAKRDEDPQVVAALRQVGVVPAPASARRATWPSRRSRSGRCRPPRTWRRCGSAAPSRRRSRRPPPARGRRDRFAPGVRVANEMVERRDAETRRPDRRRAKGA